MCLSYYVFLWIQMNFHNASINEIVCPHIRHLVFIVPHAG